MVKYIFIAFFTLLATNSFSQAKKTVVVAKPASTTAKRDTSKIKKTNAAIKKDTSHTKKTVLPIKKDTTKSSAFVKEDTAGMSPLKTMTYTQYKAYINGVDLSHMAAVAELNGYPDPQKLLICIKELSLSPSQVADITTINNGLQRKMKEMGALIIKNETTLDNMFRYNKVDEGNLIFYGQRTDLYRGELRNAILQAYVKVYAVLTPAQRKKYQQLHYLKVN